MLRISLFTSRGKRRAKKRTASKARTIGASRNSARTPRVESVVKAMVEAVDTSVGRIMEAIRELNLDEDTFVFFTSDNGGYLDYAGKFDGEISSNGPYRGQKTEVWEGGHRVPAIAWWPGRIAPGTVTDEVTMTMDLLPTYCDLATVKTPARFDGVSLAPLLFDDAALPARDVFWRMDDEKAIRRGPWKLVDVGGAPQLYNIERDPAETADVSDAHPEIVQGMQAALSAWEHDVDRSAKADRP